MRILDAISKAQGASKLWPLSPCAMCFYGIKGIQRLGSLHKTSNDPPDLCKCLVILALS